MANLELETLGGPVPFVVDPRMRVSLGDAAPAGRSGLLIEGISSGGVALGFIPRRLAPDIVLAASEPDLNRLWPDVKKFLDLYEYVGAKAGGLLIAHIVEVAGPTPEHWGPSAVVLADTIRELTESTPDGLEVTTEMKPFAPSTGVIGYNALVMRDRPSFEWKMNMLEIEANSAPTVPLLNAV